MMKLCIEILRGVFLLVALEVMWWRMNRSERREFNGELED